MSLTAARRIYLVSCAAVVGIYVLMPSSRAATTIAFGALSLAAMVFAAKRRRPVRARAWLLIGVAIAALTIALVIVSGQTGPTGSPPPFPGPADIFFLAAYVPLAFGLLDIGRPALAGPDAMLMLDITGLTVSGSLVVWVTLIRPAVASQQLSGTAKLVLVASWVGYIAVLASAVRVAVRWQPNPALTQLVAGAIAFLVADLAYSQNLIEGEWKHIPVVYFGYGALMVLAGSASLTAARWGVEVATRPAHHLGVRRMAILAIALLVAPTVLLVEATEGAVQTGVAIALTGLSVGVIVLARVWLSAGASRRRAVRERAALTAMRSLVEATTNAEVTTALRTALGTMLPPPTTCAVLVGPTEDRPSIVDAEPTRLVAPIVRTVSPPMQKDPRPRDEIVFIAPGDELAELRPTLLALSNQAGAALDRIEMMRRLRAEERERYFRTLVLTSTDATLITRVGRIEYATPSARTIFGRDVLGDHFNDLVRRSSVDDRPDPRPWSDEEEEADGYVVHADGHETAVMVHRRDLTTDPTVNGVVSTLRDVTAERELRRDLAYRASHDSLTGLANAQAFGDELRQEDASARRRPDRRGRPGQGRAALFVDLDDFKNVNDTYGHQVGDQLLAEVGQRIRSCLRDNDVAARLGGDEFAVLLREVNDEPAAHAVAQRIVDVLAEPFRVGGIPLSAHASVGLAYTSRLGDLDSLLRNADTALYTAKAHGKGQWWQYRDGMTNPSKENSDQRRRLEDALDQGELSVHYQPIVELRTGVSVGLEALVRFVDPRQPMTTSRLIAVAEESGLIGRVGEFVLRRALADAGGWDPDVFVSVNVSARQLQQPVFAETVEAELAAAGFDPTRLILEITETMPVGDDRSWTYLHRLRDRGVRVAIDDYGTGHASLTYLRQPIIDVVKIDQSFVDDLSTARDRRLLLAITELCRDLGLETIAEGVSDADRRDALIERGMPLRAGVLLLPRAPGRRGGAVAGRTPAGLTRAPPSSVAAVPGRRSSGRAGPRRCRPRPGPPPRSRCAVRTRRRAGPWNRAARASAGRPSPRSAGDGPGRSGPGPCDGPAPPPGPQWTV